MNSEVETVIFTDGACLENPGPGGYAALILSGANERVITGRDPDTTNNRMEMMAAIKALEAVPVGTRATLYSDSQLLIKGMNEWLPGWKAKGWKNSQKQPVANQALWEALDTLNGTRQITWRWVRGHAGHEQNERVDGLADAEAQKAAEVIGWTEGFRYGFKPVEPAS